MQSVTNIGTEIKVVVHLECGGVKTEDMDFVCHFFTDPKKEVIVKKKDMKTDGAGGYIAVVDTSGMSAGVVMMRVEAEVPDKDCADEYRTEITTVSTRIQIVK